MYQSLEILKISITAIKIHFTGISLSNTCIVTKYWLCIQISHVKRWNPVVDLMLPVNFIYPEGFILEVYIFFKNVDITYNCGTQ